MTGLDFLEFDLGHNGSGPINVQFYVQASTGFTFVALGPGPGGHARHQHVPGAADGLDGRPGGLPPHDRLQRPRPRRVGNVTWTLNEVRAGGTPLTTARPDHARHRHRRRRPPGRDRQLRPRRHPGQQRRAEPDRPVPQPRRHRLAPVDRPRRSAGRRHLLGQRHGLERQHVQQPRRPTCPTTRPSTIRISATDPQRRRRHPRLQRVLPDEQLRVPVRRGRRQPEHPHRRRSSTSSRSRWPG